MDRTEGNNGAQVRTGTEYLDALNKSLGSNRDTEGLGAMAIAGGGLIIGSVHAINGQDGEEVEFPIRFASTGKIKSQLVNFENFYLF